MSYSTKRCPVCNGRLRLVNVIKVDTFRKPEAKQYDLSVSRRMANKLNKIAPQELMCVSCANRFAQDSLPAVSNVQVVQGSGVPATAVAKKRSYAKDNIITTAIIVIGLAALGVLAYFTYKHSETLLGYGRQLVNWIENAMGFAGNLKK